MNELKEIIAKFRDGSIDALCVLGPTASGKTKYAVQMCRNMKKEGVEAEIISADSRQVYRGMDIGTGKDLCEYGDIPYHLIDIVDAGEKYTIYEYQRDFHRVYEELRSRGVFPVICGGSGLYICAAVEAYPLPDVPENARLRAELEEKDSETLRKMSGLPEENSRKRLIRAIEVADEASRRVVNYSNFKKLKVYNIGLNPPKEERNARIDARLDARIREGMIEEAQKLIESGVAEESLEYYGLEYKYLSLYLKGVLGLEDMKRQLADAIHRFAKRQMTWFRHMEASGTKIYWVEGE